MAKKKGARTILGLVCQDCGRQNYVSSRNKINTPDALKLNKYCQQCRKVTGHKEKKKLH